MKFNDLEHKIHKTFEHISASAPEIICIYKDYVIVKYEERDFETGCATKDYLYTLVNSEGIQCCSISYQDLDLCKRVIDSGDVSDLNKIQMIVDAYNAEKKYIRHAV